jgi:hypothetical protein
MKVGDLVKIDKWYGCWFERPNSPTKEWKGIWLVTMIDDNWAHIAKGKQTNFSIPLDCLEKVE